MVDVEQQLNVFRKEFSIAETVPRGEVIRRMIIEQMNSAQENWGSESGKPQYVKARTQIDRQNKKREPYHRTFTEQHKANMHKPKTIKTVGSGNYKKSVEHRRKISLALRGNMVRSAAWKKNRSERMTGKRNPAYVDITLHLKHKRWGTEFHGSPEQLINQDRVRTDGRIILHRRDLIRLQKGTLRAKSYHDWIKIS